jgi:hypothetical protein
MEKKADTQAPSAEDKVPFAQTPAGFSYKVHPKVCSNLSAHIEHRFRVGSKMSV